VLEAITHNRRQVQGQLPVNGLGNSASQLPRKEWPLKMTKEVLCSPQQRVRPTVTENTILMSPPRIGHIHEQVVPREVKGETIPESLNGLHKGFLQKTRVMTMSSINSSLFKGRKWVFPRIDYIRENPDKLLKGDTLRTLCLAAELDIMCNIERYLKEVAGLLEDL
jgi:hypothetical protein